MRLFIARNYKRVAIFSMACISSVYFLAGCDKISFLSPKKGASQKAQASLSTVKGTVIAKVNNIPITLEELNRYIDIYNASIDLRQDLTPEQKKEATIESRDKKIDYLKTILVRQTVFYQEALDRGLDRKEEITQVLERYRVALLAQELQNDLIKNIEISSAEVEEAYKNNPQLFREPEARKVREIVFKGEDEARPALIELLQGGDFASMARTRSIVDSRNNAGDIGSIKKGARGEAYAGFDDIVFSPALQKGAISSVFKGPEGYYIVKIEDVKEGKVVSLSEAWDTIKAILLLRKQKEALDTIYSQISSKSKIEVYEGEIK